MYMVEFNNEESAKNLASQSKVQNRIASLKFKHQIGGRKSRIKKPAPEENVKEQLKKCENVSFL